MVATATEQPIGHARKQLDPKRFVVVHDVPVFDEHEIEEPVYDPQSGRIIGTNVVRYTRDVLEAICRNVNERIEDTGDYTALCLGHTPTPAERQRGVDQPEVVGVAGPFYVGTIGTKNPRAAIIAKDWGIYREDYARVSKGFPRRSVEVWREENPKERYFDPIALLGGETPARDLGLAYSLRNHGLLVSRYSAGTMAAFPGGSNTFIPGSGDEQRRYESEESPEPPTHDDLGGHAMALTDEEVNQILDAFMQTDVCQWVLMKMQEEQAKAPPTDIPPEAAAAPPEVPGGGPPGQMPPGEAPPAGPPEAAAGPPPDKGGNGDANGGPPPKDDKEKDKMPYSKEASMQRATENQADARIAALEAQNAELTTRLGAIEADARQKVRYSQIETWSTKYIIDPQEEYSLADEADDSVWEQHGKDIERYSMRNPVGMEPLQPSGPIQPDAQDTPAFQRRFREKVTRYANLGVRKMHEEILAEVRQEMGLNGAAK